MTTTTHRFNALETMRDMLGMARQELADRAGVPVDVLDMLERGEVAATTPPAVCLTCGHIERDWTPAAKRLADAWQAARGEAVSA